MMKRGLLWLLAVCTIFASVWSAALEFWPWNKTILTNDPDDVVSQDISDSESDSIINAGIDAIGGWEIDGIFVGEGIEDNAWAWEKMTEIMSGVINYALWVIGLVALWYMIFNGMVTLTAGADEERAQRGRKGMKVAALAIAGIALSWFIISLLFYILFSVTNSL